MGNANHRGYTKQDYSFQEELLEQTYMAALNPLHYKLMQIFLQIRYKGIAL